MFLVQNIFLSLFSLMWNEEKDWKVKGQSEIWENIPTQFFHDDSMNSERSNQNKMHINCTGMCVGYVYTLPHNRKISDTSHLQLAHTLQKKTHDLTCCTYPYSQCQSCKVCLDSDPLAQRNNLWNSFFNRSEAICVVQTLEHTLCQFAIRSLSWLKVHHVL